MGRSSDVAELVRRGLTPTEIARELGVTVESVRDTCIAQWAKACLDARTSTSPFQKIVAALTLTLEQWYSEPAHALGDMYEDLRCIETTLHEKIREALIRRFGETESGWWRQGVPESVRVKCQERREKDTDDPCQAFCYSDLLDLDLVLQDQWLLLNNLFPEYRANRKELSKDLRKLNRIRNKIMHPVRGWVPDETDFDFVRRLQRALRCS